VAITDTYAEFQNLQFRDIRYKAETTDRKGNTPSTTNEF
jgi:hypothetical protein